MKDKEAIERARYLCSIDTYLEKEMLTSLLNIIKSQEQEICLLKMMYRGTDEFKSIEKLADKGVL